MESIAELQPIMNAPAGTATIWTCAALVSVEHACASGGAASGHGGGGGGWASMAASGIAASINRGASGCAIWPPPPSVVAFVAPAQPEISRNHILIPRG